MTSMLRQRYKSMPCSFKLNSFRLYQALKMHVIAISLLLLVLTGCNATPQIVGRWQSTDSSGQTVVLVLKPDSNFEAITKGEHLEGKWSLDEKAEPNKLTLSFESRTVTSIVQVQGQSLIIEQIDDDKDAPLKFNSKKSAYYKREQ